MIGAQSQRDFVRARRRRPPAKPGEITAAAGVVLAGLVIIAAIVLLDPRWQRILAAWPDRVAGAPRDADVASPPIRPEGLAGQPATVEAPKVTPREAPEPAPQQPAPARPARVGPMPPTSRLPRPAQSDTTQIMASLLVAQLGHDPAWRTAVANADAHVANSPEHAYWRAVASAIREGLRPRP